MTGARPEGDPAEHGPEARLARLENVVLRLSAEVDGLATFVDASRPGAEPDAGEDGVPAPEPVFATVVAWMHGFFLPTFVRPFGGQLRWCERWSLHEEAMLRLEAMWRAWEVLRLDGGVGLSDYLLHHLDPGLRALTSGTGPFARCSPDRHVDAGDLSAPP